MSLPILTAVTDSVVEAGLVSAFDRHDLGVTVVRRCVDLPDLLAAATTGAARAALLSADLRRFDREALARLTMANVAVVGLVAPGDEAGERRLRQLGIVAVITADATVEEVAGAVVEAARALSNRAAVGPVSIRHGFSEPVAGYGTARPPVLDRAGRPDDEREPAPVAEGRVIAVWGPTGAPGRTTIALSLAAELADLGASTLLVDADSYGGSIGQLVGLLEEAPGLAAAARAANQGMLDVPRLAVLCRDLGGGLRVLPGIARPSRWPELRPSALENVLELSRRLARFVIVDCGFCLEADEELAFDTSAPRRNGATHAVLAAADTVIAVSSAEPVGLVRFVRGLSDLRDLVPGVEPLVVVNRLRASVAGGDPRREITRALNRHTDTEPVALVPYDLAAFDAAQAAGQLLRDIAPASPARAAIRELATRLAGRAPRGQRQRQRRRLPAR
ncbi:chromosome partitioning protein [Frankia sp. CNm7]|uniref:Chromosome partitioning protein n=1 Tax=Frankia nepalensis TaxID=1836974 RepID=A0A937RGG9_9ACTN|nr:chromosome partitioning protein [Frankia nepalensis]MBL7499135.1 chromosome partitioning protein [Frankia nepalensis]MBL7516386.1 chromosome partitioning protein [Frankia nepalensis]MBL7522088.1 chromosome partitioning protein [Frankia nepalensis]MBL7625928.1 chromosome partitioning protein [Frankia nepalensis]